MVSNDFSCEEFICFLKENSVDFSLLKKYSDEILEMSKVNKLGLEQKNSKKITEIMCDLFGKSQVLFHGVNPTSDFEVDMCLESDGKNIIITGRKDKDVIDWTMNPLIGIKHASFMNSYGLLLVVKKDNEIFRLPKYGPVGKELIHRVPTKKQHFNDFEVLTDLEIKIPKSSLVIFVQTQKVKIAILKRVKDVRLIKIHKFSKLEKALRNAINEAPERVIRE